MIRPSACEISLLPEVAHEHGREARVTARGHDCDAVTDRPQGKPGQPLLQPESHGRGQGTVDDRDPARGAAKEARAAERAMARYPEPLEVLSGTDPQMSPPPPTHRNDRHKLGAAKKPTK